jgi:DNA modification methylase
MTRVVDQAEGQAWVSYCGDSAEVLAGLPTSSVDFSVYSPPFASLYTYSPSERDLGNSHSEREFWRHFRFVSTELVRVHRPGRLMAVHVAQVPSLKERDGVIGLKDFRGQTIRHFQRAGFTFFREVCIDKDPQAQAIRTKSKALLFTQFKKDRAWSGPALADYILLFRAPGENSVLIQGDPLTNNEWIELARPVWYGIRESDTLNVQPARSADDERHICPLQLGVIERCIRLWTNPGETVLDPFAGIGSVGVVALRHRRQFVGVELNQQYWRIGVTNLKRAETNVAMPSLFDELVSEAGSA